MKPVYDSIPLQGGAHQGGITSIQVAPKEWLTASPVVDFGTGKITTAVTLLPNLWMNLNFIENSYDFNETGKSNRSGPYFETTIKGIINLNSPYIQQILTTLRYHELVCLVSDREKNIKFVGDTTKGMILQFNTSNINTSGGVKSIPITLTFESEDVAPFYDV